MSEVTPRLTEVRSLRHGGLDLLILSSSQVAPLRNRVMPVEMVERRPVLLRERHNAADHLPAMAYPLREAAWVNETSRHDPVSQ